MLVSLQLSHTHTHGDVINERVMVVAVVVVVLLLRCASRQLSERHSQCVCVWKKKKKKKKIVVVVVVATHTHTTNRKKKKKKKKHWGYTPWLQKTLGAISPGRRCAVFSCACFVCPPTTTSTTTTTTFLSLHVNQMSRRWIVVCIASAVRQLRWRRFVANVVGRSVVVVVALWCSGSPIALVDKRRASIQLRGFHGCLGWKLVECRSGSRRRCFGADWRRSVIVTCCCCRHRRCSKSSPSGGFAHARSLAFDRGRTKDYRIGSHATASRRGTRNWNCQVYICPATYYYPPSWPALPLSPSSQLFYNVPTTRSTIGQTLPNSPSRQLLSGFTRSLHFRFDGGRLSLTSNPAVELSSCCYSSIGFPINNNRVEGGGGRKRSWRRRRRRRRRQRRKLWPIFQLFRRHVQCFSLLPFDSCRKKQREELHAHTVLPPVDQ